MKMGDRFTAVATIVDHEAESLVGRVHPDRTCDLSRHDEKMTEQGTVLHARLANPGDGLARDDEDVRRSLR